MKRLLGIVLAVFLMVPGGLWAYGTSQEELLQRIQQLEQELQALKRQLQEVKEAQEESSEAVEEMSDLAEKLKDNAGKFQIWGDIRTRIDSTRAYVPENGYMFGLLPLFRDASVGLYGPAYQAMFNGEIPLDPNQRAKLERAARGGHEENDTIWTNRMRINFKVNPTENTNVKVRLAYYKVWGMTNDYIAPGLFPPAANNFTLGVRPSDNRLYVDRAYFNWVNVGGYPIWISFGRRPTTHGSPQHLREGLDKKEASPSGINIDVPFDGATIGFQYRWPWPGRIRFCYGRGFESGFKMPIDRAKDDVDFYGFVWDVLDDPDRNMMLIVQAFKAEGVMDFPDGTWYMYAPAFQQWMPFGVTTQNNLGDIYELGATWIHKVDIPYLGLEGVDYFISAGLSITDPDDYGYMFMPLNYDGDYLYMYYTLLGGPYLTLKGTMDLTPNAEAAIKKAMDTRTGWAVYVGARIPLPWVPGAKLGLEYNYGSKWWLPFMVGTDDVYFNKLATRGHVAEVYWIQDLPAGEALSKYARVFLRVGFQYYWFNYSGSGVWLGEPHQIKSEIKNPQELFGEFAAKYYIQNATMFQPIDHMYNLYASFEVYF